MNTTPQNNLQVRPVFAALLFGAAASIFLLVDVKLLLEYIQAPSPTNATWCISVISPAVPLIYFAVRGFKKGRNGAFASLPELPCLVVTLLFIALALLLGFISGKWSQAIFPSVAAAMFSLCIKEVRWVIFAFGQCLP